MTAVYGQCPNGCGATLFLGAGGHVTCSWHGCPDPGAADELLSRAASIRTAAAVLVDELKDAWWARAADHLNVLRRWVREPAHLDRERTHADSEADR